MGLPLRHGTVFSRTGLRFVEGGNTFLVFIWYLVDWWTADETGDENHKIKTIRKQLEPGPNQ